MPRPYSTDLRGRALLACERDGDGCAEVARRFRVGISTRHLWRKQARDEGRRGARPMGRGPAPRRPAGNPIGEYDFGWIDVEHFVDYRACSTSSKKRM